VLPPAVKGFSNPDQRKINRWLNSTDYGVKSKEVSVDLDDGDVIEVPEAEIPTLL